MTLNQPRQKTIKRLFALSGNRCYFSTCNNPLVDESGKVTGRICHIKGRKSGSPRYDPTQSDEERHGFDNLLLMCPLHHDVIDSDPDSYSVTRLKEIKVKHETLFAGGMEPSDDIANQFLFNLSQGSIIYTKNQKGGQTAHSIVNIITSDGAQDLKLIDEKSTEIQKLLDKLIKLIIKLYRTKSKSAYHFSSIIHKSNILQSYFGIIASSSPNKPIDDEYIYFLDGKYYIIPNSGTLRIESEKGGYNNLISWSSHPVKIKNVLSKFFKDIINFVKEEHNINLNINSDFFLNEFEKLISERGFCIRCGISIDYNSSYPYCDNCYGVWAEFNNPEYLENFCHLCGEKFPTSKNKPLCDDCYWNK